MILPHDALKIPGARPMFIEGQPMAHLSDAPSRYRIASTAGFIVPDPLSLEYPFIIDYPTYLLPHQRKVIAKLWHGGLLADAPRMGKTVSAIGWAETRAKHAGHTLSCLIVCPAILIKQWLLHIEKFGSTNVRYDVRSMDSAFPPACNLLIVDEARHFKHPTIGRYGRIEEVHRESTLCLEATPVPDYVTDLYGPLHLAFPERFPSLEQFEDVYVWKHGMIRIANDAELQEDTEDVMIWRKKDYVRDHITIDHESETAAFERLLTLPRPIVAFCNTRDQAKHIGDALNAVIITGHTSQSKRVKAVQAFQSGEIDAIVSTFWAAGEGVDLSNAKTCAVFGYDWTPGTITQSVARTDHIDPKREKANVYFLLWPGSAQERFDRADLKTRMVPDYAEVVSI